MIKLIILTILFISEYISVSADTKRYANRYITNRQPDGYILYQQETVQIMVEPSKLISADVNPTQSVRLFNNFEKQRNRVEPKNQVGGEYNERFSGVYQRKPNFHQAPRLKTSRNGQGRTLVDNEYHEAPSPTIYHKSNSYQQENRQLVVGYIDKSSAKLDDSYKETNVPSYSSQPKQENVYNDQKSTTSRYNPPESLYNYPQDPNVIIDGNFGTDHYISVTRGFETISLTPSIVQSHHNDKPIDSTSITIAPPNKYIVSGTISNSEEDGEEPKVTVEEVEEIILPDEQPSLESTTDDVRLESNNEVYDDTFVGQYYYGRRGEGNTTFPLPSCFYNPSGYVCCNLMLNELITVTYTRKNVVTSNNCNTERVANHLQRHTQKVFTANFEIIVSREDFAQKIHFKNDLVCKAYIDGRYILAYASAEDVKADKIIPPVPSKNIIRDSEALRSTVIESIDNF